MPQKKIRYTFSYGPGVCATIKLWLRRTLVLPEKMQHGKEFSISTLLLIVQNVEECDATGDAISTAARPIKIFIYQLPSTLSPLFVRYEKIEE